MDEGNDLNRLAQAGNEALRTDEELIKASLRVATKIANAVPEELVGKTDMGDDLGMGYYVRLFHTSRELRWVDDRHYWVFEGNSAIDIQLKLARQLGNDIKKGFLTQLREKIEAYRASAQNLLNALQEGENQLDSRT